MSEICEKTVLEMYKNNRSTGEISEHFNTYPNKIRRILKKNNCPLRGRSAAQKVALKTGRGEHPTAGKTRNETTKKKIGESVGKVWDQLSPEELERRCNLSKEAWENKTEEEKQEFFKRGRMAVREAAKKGSKLENFLLSALIKEGFRVQFHMSQWLQNEKLEVDLFVSNLKTAIEVDGRSHFDPVWGSEALQKQKRSDLQKNGLILGSGFCMIRVIHPKRGSQRKFDSVLEKLVTVLRQIEHKFPEEGERYFEI